MSATEHAVNDAATNPPPPIAAETPYPAYPPRAVAPVRDSRAKSPRLAAFFSLMPGLGQVYVGYYPRGFVNIVVVAGIISVLGSTEADEPFVPLLAMFLVFFWMYNMIDAARLATLFNRALAGGREPALPEGFELPSMGGSILGGSILLAAGFVVLLHTRWGMRLDWLREWWPVIPMIFGVYLVARAVYDRKARLAS